MRKEASRRRGWMRVVEGGSALAPHPYPGADLELGLEPCCLASSVLLGNLLVFFASCFISNTQTIVEAATQH